MDDKSTNQTRFTRSFSVVDHWPLVVALLANLVLSLVIFRIVREGDRSLVAAKIEQQGQQLADAIDQSIEANLTVLDAMAGFFAGAQHVSREEFATFTNAGRLLRDEVQALEWIPRVAHKDRDRFEAEGQRWRSGFQFTERNDGQVGRAARRAEYFPVFYVEPLAGNEKAVGFDLASNPTRRQALEQSRDSGQLVATARITLVQETGKQAGVLIFRPHYRGDPRQLTSPAERRQAFLGYMLGVFRVGDMIHGVLNESQLGVTLEDRSGGTAERLFEENVGKDSLGRFAAEFELSMPARQWVLVVQPSREFASSLVPKRAMEVFVGGILYTAVLAGFLAVYVARLNRKNREADALTAQIEDSRDELEMRVKQRTAELQHSNEELERFASIASHDLQEPLRHVAGFSEMLGKRYQGKLDDEADEYIGYILDAVARMRQLIKDLLAFSRTGRRELKIVEVESRESVNIAIGNLQATIDEASAEVTLGDLPLVLASPSMLIQVFQNLIGNAIKYRGDTAVKVDINATRRNGQWCFSVADNGAGIAPEYHDQVFEVFRRLHGKEIAGTGIGLAICQRIIERHGGKMWVDSAIGAGATFFFTLPQ